MGSSHSICLNLPWRATLLLASWVDRCYVVRLARPHKHGNTYETPALDGERLIFSARCGTGGGGPCFRPVSPAVLGSGQGRVPLQMFLV